MTTESHLDIFIIYDREKLFQELNLSTKSIQQLPEIIKACINISLVTFFNNMLT